MKKLLTAALLLASVSVFAQGEVTKKPHHNKKPKSAVTAPAATPVEAPAK